MNLRNISDATLLAQTQQAVSREREATAGVLHHLLEVERRRLYAARGFSSLFEYAVKELGYSESSAQRRISSMRALREMPELEEKIETGALSLTVISQAQTLFRQERMEIPQKREILKSLEGKSSREAEKILAPMSTQPIPCEKVRPLSETHSEVRFVASGELLEDLEKLKDLLGQQSLAEVIQKAVQLALKKLDPAPKPDKPLPAPQPTRSIHLALKAFIRKRDQGQCSYVDALTQRRCASRHALQFDHQIPVALGGETSAENLRLLCPEHNAYEARRLLGDWTERYRKKGPPALTPENRASLSRSLPRQEYAAQRSTD